MIEYPLDGGPVEIRGAVTVERTVHGLIPRRLGASAQRQLPDDFMRLAVGQSAGIRLAFRTSASAVELTVRATKQVESDAAEVPIGVYELVVNGKTIMRRESMDGNRIVFSFERPSSYVLGGPATVLLFDDLPDGEKDIELWLPYTEEVELLSVSADAPVTAPDPARGTRWLHHGSSISHGYRASSTTATWPVIAARGAGAELTNLGFSGNALLDPLTARTMRDTPADVISVKIGINLVNGDMMRLRVFRTAVHGFLDTIRDGHATAPLLVISPIFCEPVENVAGPTVQDPARDYDWSIAAGSADDVLQGKLSLSVIRSEMGRLVRERSESDAALFYLDGLRLYGPDDARTIPLPDNLHPSDEAHQLIATRFERIAFANGGPFARPAASPFAA